MMKVKELILILLRHDENMAVLVDGYEYGMCDLEARHIERIRFFRDVNSSSCAGPHKGAAGGDELGLILGRG